MYTLCQHLRAPNDANGNPRRIWMEYKLVDPDELSGHARATLHDEGYNGKPDHLREAIELPSLDISAAEYRDMLRRYADD